MRKIYVLLILFLLFQCKNDDDVIDETPVSPVNYNLQAMPYAKLSDYNFFSGTLSNLNPVYGVIPYQPISQLFTDYAHKKRFVWMPTGSMAQYTSDSDLMNFPLGTILIKNFYYDNLLPSNTSKIIETRIMINKSEGWVFADYVWNEAQTEAFMDLNGSYVPISFQHNGQTISTNYRIPSETECFTCHKHNEVSSPIGVKPQNLNSVYSYSDGNMNQLAKLKSFGYLNNYPSQINTVVNWEDTSKPLQDRVRSYLDINCAHCHTQGAHCDYTPMRFRFIENNTDENLGICVPNVEPVPGYSFIIRAGQPGRSALFHRVQTNDESLRMPILGRTVVHTEAVELLNQWISSLTQTCN